MDAMKLIDENIEQVKDELSKLEVTIDELQHAYHETQIRYRTLCDLRDKLPSVVVVPITEITVTPKEPEGVGGRAFVKPQPKEFTAKTPRLHKHKGMASQPNIIYDYIKDHQNLTVKEITDALASQFTGCKQPRQRISSIISKYIKAGLLQTDSGRRLSICSKPIDIALEPPSEPIDTPIILSGNVDKIATFLRVNGPARPERIAEATQIPTGTVEFLTQKNTRVFQCDRDGKYMIII